MDKERAQNECIMASNNIFQEIDSLHSEWEKMDKSAKSGWLRERRCDLTGWQISFPIISLLGEALLMMLSGLMLADSLK